MFVPEQEQRRPGCHQDLAVISSLFGLSNCFIGIILLAQAGIGASHLGIDDGVVWAESNRALKSGQRILIPMQSVLGFRKSQMDLNVVGRKLHGSLILRLSVLELRLLAIGLGARQVNGSGVRNELGCEIGLTQRGLC